MITIEENREDKRLTVGGAAAIRKDRRREGK
jgi:hypothetical protein